jgi:anti-sigma regulatory factor (Ser/Thr protein kinase)
MTTVNRSRPPPHTVELDCWSITCAAELSSLRVSLCQAVTRLQPSAADSIGEVAERVALVATELATNALQHGLPPTTVRLLRHDDRLVLDVADHDPGTTPHGPAASSTNNRGRGLAIVRSMSLQVGWYATGRTKHIWASFPITAEHVPTPAR